MLNNLRLLLLPFSFVYGLIVLVRNKFYDWGIFKSTGYHMPIICVGNLAVGGSGKTPTTEYLVRLLSQYKVAILSRGYGRKTKGFILAGNTSTAETIGDEPLQYYQKFKPITVAVCEDRRTGIDQLKNNHDVIILDDAFQHRKIKAGFNLLLFEFSELRKTQFLLPAGNLRDLFSSRKRADVLLVTKSPVDLDSHSINQSINILKPNTKQTVFHCFIKYGQLNKVYQNEQLELGYVKGKKIYLLTGIANPEPLILELEKYTSNIRYFKYADHYDFKLSDLENLKRAYNLDREEEKIIITTEKDAKRLLKSEFVHLLNSLPLFYLPIEVDFIENDKTSFDSLILNYVRKNTRHR